MLAAHAVEELFETRGTQQRELITRVTVLQILQARLVVEQRGVHMHAQGEFALAREFLVYVVANEIAAGVRHEGHIADRCDSLLRHASHLVLVGAGDVVLGEPLKAPREQLHGSSLADDAREFAVLVAVVAAALRGHGIAGHAEGLEGAGVHPQRMAITRVHNARAGGKCLIERALGGRYGRIPTVIAPALRDHPGVIGQPSGELDGARHEFSLAFAHVHEQVRGCSKCRVEEVQVGIVESGADEGIAEVEHRRARRAGGDDICGRSHELDAIAHNGKRQGASRVITHRARKDPLGRNDVIDVPKPHHMLPSKGVAI